MNPQHIPLVFIIVCIGFLSLAYFIEVRRNDRGGYEITKATDLRCDQCGIRFYATSQHDAKVFALMHTDCLNLRRFIGGDAA